MTCPCYECEFRRPGCHGDCEPFKTWRAPMDKMRAEKDKMLAVDDMLHQGRVRRSRWSKNHNRK